MVILQESVARRFLEDRGKWQSRQMLLCCIGYLASCFQNMLIVFIGFQPKFTCMENENWYQNGTAPLTFDNKCEVFNSSTNTSARCSGGFLYDVDKTNSIVSEWDLVCDSAYLSETSQLMYTIGMAVGSFLASPVADRFGRRPTTLLMRLVYTVTCFGIAWSPNITCFMIGRFLIGTLGMGFSLVIFVQLMEVTPVRLRPFSVMLTAILWPVALCTIDLVAYLMRGLPWRYIQSVMSIPTLSIVFEIIFLKESMLWLYSNKREAEASAILENALKTNGMSVEDYANDGKHLAVDPLMKGDLIDNEYENGSDKSSTQVDKTNGKKVTILDILRNRSTRVITFIVGFGWFVNSLVYYAIFFMSDSFVWDRYMNFFLNTIVELPGAALLYISLQRFGRKTPLIGLHAICALPLLVGGIMMVTLESETKYIVMQIITTFGKFVISATFSIIFIYSSEVFPTNFRASGIGIGSVTGRLGSFMAPFAGIMAKAIPWGPGVIFGGLCLIVSVTMIWGPETRNVKLPQSIGDVDTLTNKKPSKTQSSLETDRDSIKA